MVERLNRRITLVWMHNVLYYDDERVFQMKECPRMYDLENHIFPKRMLCCRRKRFLTGTFWENSSLRRKIIHGSSSFNYKAFENATVRLLNYDKEIIQETYLNWKQIWIRDEGNTARLKYYLVEQVLMAEYDEEGTFLGEDLLHMIYNSEDAPFILTILSFFAILGEKIDKIEFDWKKLGSQEDI